MSISDLKRRLSKCALCAETFSRTASAHEPRPIVWFDAEASILIAGQAPGLRVHKTGVPFTDPSGDRLRDWLGMTEDEFYDRSRVAIVPMAFCFPGYNDKGADLPPPAVCADTWHSEVIAVLKTIQLRVLVGGHAMRWHLGPIGSVTETVRRNSALSDGTFALPHPSWRNNAWLRKNQWFEDEILPKLRTAVRGALDG